MRRLPLRSPPRVWGKVRLMGSALPVTGITPACAGKSNAGLQMPVVARDHPRVCGEKCLDGFAHGMIAGSPPRVRGKNSTIHSYLNSTGSPPRMRGKAHCVLLATCGRGITPAYAGKRPVQGLPPLRCRDHPRVCGEKVRHACHG